MQLLVNALCFLSGVVTTIGGLAVWARYIAMKHRAEDAEKAQQEAEEAKRQLDEQQRQAVEAIQNSLAELAQRRNKQPKVTPVDDNASVKDRLRRAVELTALQSRINKNMGPEFVMQHNELELEKLTVLKSIIADGFDPIITIRFNTGDEDMLLSSYIQSITKGLA